SLTSELSPPVLHEFGLVAAIEWIAGKMSAESPIQFRCSDDGEVKPMGEELSTLLFHAVRELLVNAIKHSKAKNVQITIERESSTIRITVADDGIGSQWESVSPRSIRTGGFGLFNIRERLHHFGGEMNISVVQGGGTKIVLTSPLSVKSIRN
ncbi:MAG: ATP-binding protein, partial [bacterium]